MSEFVAAHQPCPCGKSSDAYSLRADGGGHCFSCGVNHGSTEGAVRQQQKKKSKRPLVDRGVFQDLKARGIDESTCRKFGYSCGVDDKGETAQIAEYYDTSGTLVAQKLRYKDKRFSITGDIAEAGLFGQQLWRAGGKRVVVTEGEIDCLSVAQATGLSWPVVSIPNGAESALKSLQSQLEWLESHETVVLWFDSDVPGEKAVEACVSLFSPGKVHVVRQSGFKDANELLKGEGPKAVSNAVWEAKEYRPDGLLDGADLWDSLTRKVERGATYPWKALDEFLLGLMPKQIITLAAGSGMGKSEVCRAIAHNLLKSGEKVGYFALEESKDRTVQGIVGLELGIPLWKPGYDAPLAEKRKAFDTLMKGGCFWLYDHWGTTDPDHLISRMRYLVKAKGVRYLFLDHISIVVSGMDLSENERRALDQIMTKLRSFTEETGVALVLVSHLSRPDGKGHEEGAITSLSQLRGSAGIAQLSDVVLGVERNQQDPDREARKVATIRVLKSRMVGETGPACAIKYDKTTGVYQEVPLPEEHEGAFANVQEEDY